MKTYMILALTLLSGCATETTMSGKQQEIITCVKDLIGAGATGTEAFETCRQVYKLRKLQE